MSKGSHVHADIVSGGGGDEDVVKMTGSSNHKAATKSGVSLGNKAESSPAQPPTKPVKQSQSVTDNVPAKKSSSPAPHHHHDNLKIKVVKISSMLSRHLQL